jgi:hypothetical protein
MSTTEHLTWHQQTAAARRWKTRNLPAHVMNFSGPYRTLCGIPKPPVTVDHQHRHNPANHTCKKCLSAADRLNLPTHTPTP